MLRHSKEAMWSGRAGDRLQLRPSRCLLRRHSDIGLSERHGSGLKSLEAKHKPSETTQCLQDKASFSFAGASVEQNERDAGRPADWDAGRLIKLSRPEMVLRLWRQSAGIAGNRQERNCDAMMPIFETGLRQQWDNPSTRCC